jgi:hypothetical protein
MHSHSPAPLAHAARAPRRPGRVPPRGGAADRLRRGLAIAVAVLACLIAAPAAHAQRVTGAIQGKIVRGGQAQPGAKITTTNLSNGSVVTVTADASGGYVVPGLAPGQYLIAV